MAHSGKTNAMRILDKAGITYQSKEYILKDGFTSGSDIARREGLPPEIVFKTLVTVSGHGEHYVCVIPVDCELDLKKAAAHFKVKKLDMMPMKMLLGVTGYIHGGCSPIGMKKLFPTVIEKSASEHEQIYISGGKIGVHIVLPPADLAALCKGGFDNIVMQ